MSVVPALASLPRPGETVDRYRVVAPIAQGGMAAVYAARREGPGGFDKLLALKLMLPHLAAERRFIDMFLDEARLVAQLQHANLVHVFDTGEHQGLPYLVMEFLSGKSFADCQRRAAELGLELPIEFVIAVLAEAATGLHAAHETVNTSGTPLGIVHRDVSPQNVHVGYDGQVKVVDFGIAYASGRLAVTRTGEVKGKLAYIAPEQLDQQQPVDRRADVWALGVMAWEAFAGRRLFHAATESSTMWNVLQAPIPPLASVAPKVPAQVAALVDACLQRDVLRRAPTALHIAEGLHSLAPAQTGLVREWAERLFGLERLSETAALATPVLDSPHDVAATVVRPKKSTALRRVALSVALLCVGALVAGGYVLAKAFRVSPPPPVVVQSVPEAGPRFIPLKPVSLPVDAPVEAPKPEAELATPLAKPEPVAAKRPIRGQKSPRAEKVEKTPTPAPATPTTAPNKTPLLTNPY